MIYGKDIGKKFDKDGNVLHYPGNTVVADIVPGCSAYDVMSHLRQMVIEAGFEDTLCLLPADSYHMTVIRGLNDLVRVDTNWPDILPKDTPMEKVDDHVSEAIARAGLPGPARMKFHKVLTGGGCVIVQVVPADEEQNKILRDFRDRAATEIGVFFPKHDEYKFHISLGYKRIIPEGKEAERFDNLVAEMDKYIENQPVFTTQPPYMAYFNDMYAFSPERLPRKNVWIESGIDLKVGRKTKMKVVTIIGAGMMGSALAFPARENGHEVRLVGTHLDREIIDECKATDKHPKFNKAFPAGIKYYQIEEVDEAIAGSTFIIGGVSSFGVDWFDDVILPKVPEEIPVLSVTKGLVDTEEGKLLTYPDVWEAKCKKMGKKLSINAIGGPCTSYELVAHDQTEVAFCGRDLEILKMMKEVMTTSYYHISLSTDVTGIESAVALKNGYALGIALTIGLNQKEFGLDSELHFNSQAAIFGQAVKEMYRLFEYQGTATLENMTVGYGDLYVTVYGGRTRLVGILLGRGLNIEEAKEELNGVTLESLVVAERVARAIKVAASKGVLDAKDFPLLMHVDEIICQKKPVNLPWEEFTFIYDK